MATTAATCTSVSSSESPIIGTTAKCARKHRFTLFIGYGDEAGRLLKKFEQLKCRLGIGTNILFLNFLLQYFEAHSKNGSSSNININNSDTTNNGNLIESAEDFIIETASTSASSAYNKLCNTKTVTNNTTTTTAQQQQQHDQSFAGNNIVDTNNDCPSGQILLRNLLEKQQTREDKLTSTVLLKNHYPPHIEKQFLQLQHHQVLQQPLEEYCKATTQNNILSPLENVLRDTSVSTPSSHSAVNSYTNHKRKEIDINVKQQKPQNEECENQDLRCIQEPINENKNDYICLSSLFTTPAINNDSTEIDSIETNDNATNECVFSPPKSKIPKIFLKDETRVNSMKSDEINNPMLVKTKAVHIINQYLEHVKRELDYYHGFISSTEKLRLFLNEYREATNMSFTVRSSRSYIKKRINSNELIATTITEVVIPDTSNIVETDANMPRKESEHVMVPLSQFSDMCKENPSQFLDEKVLDGLITGPLRWEYILGKPPIPFTGIPFFIIGNTHYQCRYACADIRTQRRKSNPDSSNKDASNKGRLRRSLKRDCKAVMCIKSIVAFPEFTVEEKISSVKSKKGCRKIKAAALEEVRKAVEQDEAVGHPAFWVYVPLPEAHTTHNDVPENEVLSSSEPENIDAITQILNVAAHYGGKVQIVQQGDENIIEFELSTDEDASSGTSIVLSGANESKLNEQISRGDDKRNIPQQQK